MIQRLLLVIVSVTIATAMQAQKPIRFGERSDSFTVIISPQTCAIEYKKTNISPVIKEKVSIYSDSLVWEYKCSDYHLRDVVRYDRNDFQSLIDSIAGKRVPVKRRFKSNAHVYYVRTHRLCFRDADGEEVTLDNQIYKPIGESVIIKERVMQFIAEHPTAASQLFESVRPRRGSRNNGILPEALEPYRIKQE